MQDQNFQEVDGKESFKCQFSKAYANDSDGSLSLVWDRNNHLNYLWLVLLAPVFYWKKNVKLWAFFSFIPYFLVINEISQPLCRKGIDCALNYNLFLISLYCITLLRPMKKVLAKGLANAQKENPLFNGQFLIYASKDAKTEILTHGLDHTLKNQAQALLERKEKEKEIKAVAKQEKFKLEQKKFLEKIDKKFSQSIKEKNQSYEFIKGEGFEAYPKNVSFTWKVANLAIEDLKDSALHSSEMNDLETLEMKLIGADRIEVLEDRTTIKIKLDQTLISIDEILSTDSHETRKITRDRKETTEFVSKQIGIPNVTQVAGRDISASVTKTKAEITVVEERGNIYRHLTLQLRDGRSFSVKREYSYEGEYAEKSYFEFDDFYKLLRKAIANKTS